MLYEGYGPGGVALLIEALTDNRNRTGADVRHSLSKHGGSLGEPGSVAYLFDKQGVIVVDAARYGEDDLIVAIDAGARGHRTRRGRVRGDHRAGRLQRGAPRAGGGRTWSWRAPTWPSARRAACRSRRSDAGKLMRLIEALEDNDDVGAVHANFDVDADMLERIARLAPDAPRS